MSTCRVLSVGFGPWIHYKDAYKVYQLCLENIYCTHVARKALLLTETVGIAEHWCSQVATKPFLLFGMGKNSLLRQNQTEGKVLLLPGYTSSQPAIPTVSVSRRAFLATCVQ